METDQGPVTYQVAGAVATITMTTPALTLAAKEALLRLVRQAASDEVVRAVVLTGTGRVFCAGQDLGEHAAALRERGEGPAGGAASAPAGQAGAVPDGAGPAGAVPDGAARDGAGQDGAVPDGAGPAGAVPDGAGPAGRAAAAFNTVEAHYNPLVTTLATMPKPVLAAINGSCAGAGLGIALACDLRIAAGGARFTTAFTGIGLTPDSGLSASLSRAVGTARASELIMLAEPFTAEDALGWGLVGRVVPAEELAGAAAEVAARLAAGPTRAYATAKHAIRQAWAAEWPDVLAAEARDQAALGATADHRGAVEAFLAKRRPEFTGRD